MRWSAQDRWIRLAASEKASNFFLARTYVHVARINLWAGSGRASVVAGAGVVRLEPRRASEPRAGLREREGRRRKSDRRPRFQATSRRRPATTPSRRTTCATTTRTAYDDTTGTGTAGTANTWFRNNGETENRPGLCKKGQ